MAPDHLTSDTHSPPPLACVLPMYLCPVGQIEGLSRAAGHIAALHAALQQSMQQQQQQQQSDATAATGTQRAAVYGKQGDGHFLGMSDGADWRALDGSNDSSTISNSNNQPIVAASTVRYREQITAIQGDDPSTSGVADRVSRGGRGCECGDPIICTPLTNGCDRNSYANGRMVHNDGVADTLVVLGEVVGGGDVGDSDDGIGRGGASFGQGAAEHSQACAPELSPEPCSPDTAAGKRAADFPHPHTGNLEEGVLERSPLVSRQKNAADFHPCLLSKEDKEDPSSGGPRPTPNGIGQGGDGCDREGEDTSPPPVPTYASTIIDSMGFDHPTAAVLSAGDLPKGAMRDSNDRLGDSVIGENRGGVAQGQRQGRGFGRGGQGLSETKSLAAMGADDFLPLFAFTLVSFLFFHYSCSIAMRWFWLS